MRQAAKRAVLLTAGLVLVACAPTQRRHDARPAYGEPSPGSFAIVSAHLKFGRMEETLNGAEVSKAFFESTGLQPVVGRLFTESEFANGAPVLVIHHEIWQARFGGRSSAIGELIALDGRHFRIVGVAPLGFNLPEPAHYWLPRASSQGTAGSVVHPSPRLAATAFAMANGFGIPTTNLVVANDVRFGGIHDARSTSPTDRSRLLPVEQTVADTTAIAKLLGASVKTGWAKEWVTCIERNCFAATTTFVLVVEEQKNDSPQVHIKLYAPATGAGERETLRSALVSVVKVQDGQWKATHYAFEPFTVAAR